MADRRRRSREAHDDAGDPGTGRQRRSEMSRRERRQRKRRAAKAARNGGRAVREDGRGSDAPDASPELDRSAVAEATEGAQPEGGGVEPSPDAGEEVLLPARGRRRGKRRDGNGVVVQELDPAGSDEVRDRTTSELLFGDGSEDHERADRADPTDPAASDVLPAAKERAGPQQTEDREEQTEEESRSEGARTQPFSRSPATASPPAGRRRGAIIALLAVALAGVLGLVALQLGWLDLARDIVVPADDEDEAREPPDDGWQPAFLLASVDDRASGGELRSLAVLATDRREERGTVLLLPTTIVADVPGFGSFTLREAWDLGGSSLVAVTVDNLLGLHLDGVLAVDSDGWASWFGPTEGATLTVGSRIVPRDGSDAVPFEPGERMLGPEEVARYVSIHGQGESELDVLPRTRQVLDALFTAIADDPAVLDAVVDAARTFAGTATPDRIRTVMGELAEAREQDELTSVTLPVVPLGSGEVDLYRTDDERVDGLIDDRFAASRDDRAAADRWAVQILNGNGRPGVGREVAEELADGNYRIMLTGNADHFNYAATRIVVYTEERDILEAAQDVQERLGGIGTIERSGTPQSVVDLTIVVGHDFPP